MPKLWLADGMGGLRLVALVVLRVLVVLAVLVLLVPTTVRYQVDGLHYKPCAQKYQRLLTLRGMGLFCNGANMVLDIRSSLHRSTCRLPKALRRSGQRLLRRLDEVDRS